MNSVYQSHIQRANLLSQGGNRKIGQAYQASETVGVDCTSFLHVVDKSGNSTNADRVLLCVAILVAAHCAHVQGST